MTSVSLDHRRATAVLTLNRPEALNALNADMLKDLEGLFGGLDADPETRCVVFTGADRCLSAGADIKAMSKMSLHDARRFMEQAHALLNRIEKSRLITIAAIHGYALGGGLEVSLACDLRVAEESAQLGFPEVRIGAFPGWGGTQRIVRLIGEGWGKFLVFTGQPLSGVEARQVGLVTHVVPDGEALSASLALAEQIGANAPGAMARAKTAIANGQYVELGPALRLELEAWLAHFETEERREGMAAFLEKRDPRWPTN